MNRTVQPDTFAAALATATPGDGLRLAPGRYRGPFRVVRAVTLEAHDPENPPEFIGRGPSLRVHLPSWAELRLHGLEWRGRIGRRGAAIRVVTGTCVVTRCRFDGNRAFGDGGAIHVAGGAELRLDECVFVENRAIGGGAVCVYEGGRVEVRGGRFLGNRGRCGGAIALDAADGSMLGVLFDGNHASNNGSAVAIRRGGQLDMVQCSLRNQRGAEFVTAEDPAPVLRIA